jgi:hypothetical protein
MSKTRKGNKNWNARSGSKIMEAALYQKIISRWQIGRCMLVMMPSSPNSVIINPVIWVLCCSSAQHESRAAQPHKQRGAN